MTVYSVMKVVYMDIANIDGRAQDYAMYKEAMKIKSIMPISCYFRHTPELVECVRSKL